MAPLHEPQDPQQPALGPPRFSLRTLLAAISLLCCLFALMSAIGLLWSTALVLFLGLILAHVLGNSLGTKLRDQASRQIDADRSLTPPTPCLPVRVNVEAPRRLTERTGLHRITLLMTVGGALVGGELGGLGLAAIYPRESIAAVGLGVISSAVLGAFAGFAASSFLSVVRQALAEAHRGADSAVQQRMAGGPR